MNIIFNYSLSDLYVIFKLDVTNDCSDYYRDCSNGHN